MLFLDHGSRFIVSLGRGDGNAGAVGKEIFKQQGFKGIPNREGYHMSEYTNVFKYDSLEEKKLMTERSTHMDEIFSETNLGSVLLTNEAIFHPFLFIFSYIPDMFAGGVSDSMITLVDMVSKNCLYFMSFSIDYL